MEFPPQVRDIIVFTIKHITPLFTGMWACSRAVYQTALGQFLSVYLLRHRRAYCRCLHATNMPVLQAISFASHWFLLPPLLGPPLALSQRNTLSEERSFEETSARNCSNLAIVPIPTHYFITSAIHFDTSFPTLPITGRSPLRR